MNGARHGRGIHSDLMALLQAFPIGPLDQHPVDLLPGRSPDGPDVFLQAALGGGPAQGQTAKLTEAHRVGHVKGQLAVGQLLPVLEHRAAHHLLPA